MEKDMTVFDNAIPMLHYFNHRVSTPSWQIDSGVINFIDLTYITGGQVVYVVDGERYAASEGDLFCIPKGAVRAAKSPNPAQFECFVANFSLHNLYGGETTMPLPMLSSLGRDADLISSFRRLSEIWLTRTPGHTMRARAQFMMILQRIMSVMVYDVDTYHFDARIKNAIRHITERFQEPLTISEVAEAVSLNPIYFGALFKKETHTTFRDYLNRIRLNQAEDMLHTGKYNVTEVANSCGFTDVFYFSRLFKRYKGIPPSSVNVIKL
ncbi:MAG: AraC family transcriptional regulator [Defluviitaleaceae bacterium]|nr:AraC family transcriptional regulator [Defluviitaleaceae bacterium]